MERIFDVLLQYFIQTDVWDERPFSEVRCFLYFKPKHFETTKIEAKTQRYNRRT